MLCRMLTLINVCFLTYILLIHKTVSVIVGIDIGSEFFKIASALPGRSFDIVLNLQSGRKTRTIVSFAESTRTIGDTALSHVTKKPSDVATLIPLLLGRAYDDESLKHIFKSIVPLNVTSDNKRHSPLFYFVSQQLALNSEDIAAHLFKGIQQLVSLYHRSKHPLKYDAVITIPESFGMREKISLVDAAKISGMNVLKLIRETNAAALYHSIDLPVNYTGTKLFINLGAWRTQACVIEYDLKKKTTKNPIRIIASKGCAESASIGGKHFDLDLTEYMIQEATTKFKNFPTEKRLLDRMYQKFLSQSTKIKHILSTNKQADFYIENMANDQDFRQSITREKFDSLIHHRLNELKVILDKVLDKSNSTLAFIDGVEVVGGSWRVPRIQDEIESLIKPLELGQHVNSDDSFALGAALLAANYSSTFRLKPIELISPSNSNYTVLIQDYNNQTKTVGEKQRDRNIISIGESLSKGVKTLTLRTCEDVLTRLIEKEIDKPEKILYEIIVTGIREKCETTYKEFGLPKVAVIFNIDATEIIRLDRVVAQWEEKYFENVVLTTPTPRDNSTNSTQAEGVKEEVKLVEKTRKHVFDCIAEIKYMPPIPLTMAEIKTKQTNLKEFEDKNTDQLNFLKLRNQFEADIYSYRERLSDGNNLYLVTTAEFRTQSLNLLDEMEDWLYGEETEHATIEVFESKLNQLESHMKAAMTLALEQERKEKLETFVASLKNTINSKLDPLLQKHSELAEDTAIVEYKKSLKKFDEWYSELKEKQKSTPLTEPPAFKAKDVEEKFTALFGDLYKLMKSIDQKLLNKKLESLKAKAMTNTTLANITSTTSKKSKENSATTTTILSTEHEEL